MHLESTHKAIFADSVSQRQAEWEREKCPRRLNRYESNILFPKYVAISGTGANRTGHDHRWGFHFWGWRTEFGCRSWKEFETKAIRIRSLGRCHPWISRDGESWLAARKSNPFRSRPTVCIRNGYNAPRTHPGFGKRRNHQATRRQFTLLWYHNCRAQSTDRLYYAIEASRWTEICATKDRRRCRYTPEKWW